MNLFLGVLPLLLAAKMGSVSAATCGGGNRGDGICSGDECCSEVRKCEKRLPLFQLPTKLIASPLQYFCSSSGVGVEHQLGIALDPILPQHRLLLPPLRLHFAAAAHAHKLYGTPSLETTLAGLELRGFKMIRKREKMRPALQLHLSSPIFAVVLRHVMSPHPLYPM